MPPSRKTQSSRRVGNVSLSSTVGAPTPARQSSSSLAARPRPLQMADISLASTAAPSTPAVPKKRVRPPRSSLTTPSMRALASTDISIASTSAAPRPHGRPPKSASHRSTVELDATASSSIATRKRGKPPSNRATDTTAPSVSVATSKMPRGRPPKPAQRDRDRDPVSPGSTSAYTSVAAPKRHGRALDNHQKTKAQFYVNSVLGLPQSKAGSSRPDKRVRPPVQPDSASDVSLVDGVSEEESDASEGEVDQSDDADLSSADEEGSALRRVKSKKRKGWPSEKERLRKWRRLSVEERECVTSEGGLIWRTAIPLLNSMPKNIRSMVADSLTRALNRIDGKLESALVPPLARIPSGTAGAAGRRDLTSSMLSWRLEEEGSLLRAENPHHQVDVMSLGMNAEITEIEQLLLPEAEQIVDLSNTLEDQKQVVERTLSEIVKLKRDRRLIKTAGSSDYPANLEANALISLTAHNPSLDSAISSFLRIPA